MKSIKLSLALLLATGTIFMSCKKELASAEAKTPDTALSSPAVASVETASFDISGMTCAMGCAKSIENKLADLDGVEKATIDFDKKTASIQYNAALQTPEKLVEFVEAVADGKTYKVSNVKSSADKAMVYQDTPKQEKPKKVKKSKKVADQTYTVSNATTPEVKTPEAAKNCGPKEEKKPGCCASKKACASEKPATL